jgi:hypothetical protein
MGVTDVQREKWESCLMSIPFDSIKLPTAKNINRMIQRATDFLVAQTDQQEEPQDSYTSDERTEYNAEKARNDRVKAFIEKHRAQGQNVGVTRSPEGQLKAYWIQDPTHKAENTYWNSTQHREDAAEFLKGGAEAVGEFAKSQADSSPVTQAHRLIMNPLGEFRKQREQTETIRQVISNPKEAVKSFKNQMHEQYVAPIQRGDMRGTGRAGGNVLLKTIEGVATKRLFGPNPGFSLRKGVNKSSHSGGSSGTPGPGPSSGPGSGPSGPGGSNGASPSKVNKSSGSKKPKPSQKGIQPNLQSQIDQFPQSPSNGYGHSDKHAPKDQKATLDAAAKVQSKGKTKKPMSWFRSQKDMDYAIKTSRDWIPEAIKDPDKMKAFQDFISTPKEKGLFSFRFPAQKNIGRGYEKMADGSVTKLNKFQSVYVEYGWVKAKGNKWKIALKTIYPHKSEAPFQK